MASKKILIVDDEPDITLTLGTGLEKGGYDVDSFDDPMIALSNFKPDIYDLLLLDIKMPNMTGFELYRKVKEIDSKVKVCFITDGEMYYGVYTDIFNSLDAKYFIRKPIDNEELVEKVNNMISS